MINWLDDWVVSVWVSIVGINNGYEEGVMIWGVMIIMELSYFFYICAVILVKIKYPISKIKI